MSSTQSSPNKKQKVDATTTIPTIQGLEDYSFRDGEEITPHGAMPQKKYYRSRAHANPLSFNDNLTYPTKPDDFDWQPYYPELPSSSSAPTVIDIGCGFGGLTVELSTLLPDATVLGLEIRAKVCEYVRLRIMSLRETEKGNYKNAACMRSNTMKNLVNYMHPNSLNKIFICFPDPHFKAKNHRRRIVSYDLLTEYAYCLKPNALLYLITDVKALHEWHLEKTDAHEMFARLSDDAMENDPCVKAMINVTEEGKKVERSGSNKYFMVYRRLPEEEVALETSEFLK
ncbi:hypothetical protein TL16_g11547 [Triparma laevis f. inornata]|uniref:tRNA (guanine-N(7)-)-methyltransferase n=2 Tax=Triparma laevis TaxID=1534972 RepID=A0A9W7ADP7_9STRA|nr:hypothetical protein TrLO_g5742 [Triparma laevis f. longispina]GMH89738.1 hypothetical protein TL16_g11547 [Triparma laevis f. inornata]